MSHFLLRERGGGSAWLKCTRAGENGPMVGEKCLGARRIGSRADRLGFSRKSREFQPIARNFQTSLIWLRERDGGVAWLKCERVGRNGPRAGQLARNQAGRIEGRSVRIFAQITRIPADRQDPPNAAFFWLRERDGGAAWPKCERVGRNGPRAGQLARNQEGRIEGRSVRIFAKISRIPVDRQEPPNVALLVARARRRSGVAEMRESHRNDP